MKTSRLIQCLICLVLVCCLIVNISPIQAKASILQDAYNMFIAGEWVLSSIFKGLGVSPGADWLDYDNAVNNCITDMKQSASELFDMINGDGEIQIYRGTSGTGAFIYYVSSAVVNFARSWLFDSGNLSVSGADYSESHSVYYWNGSHVFTGNKPFTPVLIVRPGDAFLCFVANESFYLYRDDKLYNGEGYTTSGGTFYYVYGSYSTADWDWLMTKVSQCTGVNVVYADDFEILDSITPGASVSVSDKFTTGEIALPDVELATGYSDWAANSVTYGSDDDDGPKVYYPLALGPTLEDTIGMSQSDVWYGNSTYVDSSTDTETGTGTTDTVTASGLKGWLDSMVSAIGGWFSDVLSAIRAVPEAFSRWFQDVITGLQTIGNAITQAWEDAVAAVLVGIQSIFVPKEDFVTAKVEALRAEFAFADSIITTGEFIGTSLAGLGTQPPVIYIHLGDTRGSYNIGGTVPFLDLRWYEEYKPIGDAIISAFLWLMFAWRIYIKAPGIIRGIPGDVEIVRNVSGKD